MQSTILRSAIRASPRSATITRSSRNTIRRNLASEAPGASTKGDSTRSVPPSGGSRFPFIIGGGVIFLLVAGRYILASDKPAASGHAEQQRIRREGSIRDERRDPRDSGVKTLEQKRQQQQQSS